MITRRALVGNAGVIALTSFASGKQAFAQTYPTQDIQVVCAFPPGSGADVLVRYYAEKLRAISGRTVLVINKPGAAGYIATEYVARSKPDGYTLYIFGATAIAASKYLIKNPAVDVATSFQVAATLSNLPWTLVVGPQSPYKTAVELTAGLKTKGSDATYAVTTTTAVIMAGLYKKATGIQAVEVSYRTAPDTLGELTGGKLDFALLDPTFTMAQERAGRLRILAVSTGERLKALPNVPTMTESGVPMDINLWWGVFLPAGTPRPIVEMINRWFGQIVRTEETRDFLASSGADPMIRTAEEAQEMYKHTLVEWEEYVRITNLQPQ